MVLYRWSRVQILVDSGPVIPQITLTIRRLGFDPFHEGGGITHRGLMFGADVWKRPNR